MLNKLLVRGSIVMVVLSLLLCPWGVGGVFGSGWVPTVDGIVEPEWRDYGQTHIMYEAGKSYKPALGQVTAYCVGERFFVLVETPYALDPSFNENWVRRYPLVTPNSPLPREEFAFLTDGLGWEASFIVDPSWTIFVHISVQTASTIFLPGAETQTAETLVFPACHSTAVTISSFEAAPQGDDILVTWETASELDNVGFNLYRSETAEGPYTPLNSTLITPQFPGEVMGGYYEWLDTDVQPGVTYFYKLEDIDVKGISTFHGPISVASTTSPSAVQIRDFYMDGPDWVPTIILVPAILITLVFLLWFLRHLRRRL
jgi:hypothetical protein